MSRIASFAVATALALGTLSAATVRADEPYKPEYKEPLGVLVIKKEDYRTKKECRYYFDKEDFYKYPPDPRDYLVTKYFKLEKKYDKKELKCDFYLKYPPKSAVVERGFKCLIIVFNKYNKPIYRDYTDESHWVATPSGQGKLKCEFEKDDGYGYDS